MTGPADDAEGQSRLAGFLRGLQELGWTAGGNLRIDYRWADDNTHRRQYAAELIALAPEVIFASTSSSTAALQQASQTVPIVFASVTDPVGQGFVASLPHPGGNITGFALYEYGIDTKWLELLKEIAPIFPSRSHVALHEWRTGRNARRGAVAPRGCQRCQRSRCWRDRARHRHIRSSA
jgi:putative ABC transport system substrate-binding protein